MLKKTILFLFFIIISFSQVNSQWVQTSGPNVQYVYSLMLNGNYLFAATNEGIYVTTNNGTLWTKKSNGLLTNLNNYYSLIYSDSKIIAGSDSGIYVSANNGETWTKKSTGLGSARIFKAFLKYNSTSLFAASTKGVFLSTDNGETWMARNSGIEYNPIYSFTVKNNNIYAGGDRKVFVSTDAGISWTSKSSGLPDYTAQALAAMGSNLIVGMCCGSGIYVSTNDGERWEKIQQDLSAIVYVVNGSRIIAGTIQGVWVSTDAGVTWTEYNQGLQYLTTTALAFNSTKMFAGVELYVWSRPVGQLIGIENISTEIPAQYSLSQNYPNPFNPTTKIRFAIPPLSSSPSEGGDRGVVLIIYDILGKEVASLIPSQGQEGLLPGTYEVEWDASNYPSGVYYYKLNAGSYSETKKMILVK